VTGAAIVARGTWVYDGVAAMPVFVIATDFDFWFEVADADDDLDPGEQPDLNAEGRLYYLSFHGLRDGGNFWPDSVHYRSIDEAKLAGQSRVPSPIVWDSATDESRASITHND
jgi:hypothetical protein